MMYFLALDWFDCFNKFLFTYSTATMKVAGSSKVIKFYNFTKKIKILFRSSEHLSKIISR